MAKIIPSFAIVLLLVPILGNGGLSQYDAYGSSYTPTFGGGTYHYTDGLVINGKTFDISGYSQTIQTQNLTVGVPSKITLKIFDNAGSYAIRAATLFLNIRGSGVSIQKSDTSVQYSVSGITAIQDPHHFIGTAKGSISYTGKFAYVTFTLTPHSTMKTSDIIASSTDDRLSTGYSLIIDAVSFSAKTPGNSTLGIDYTHQHCTATNPCQKICGDHVCKPGESPKNQ